ncbi:MAG: heavy-metal-associated domain-containing protein, partial [Muricoprocola sp.]
KETKQMEKTMKIEGMMCGHCEARVKKTLEAIEGVTEAVVSYTEGTAVVKMTQEIPDEVLKNAVEAQDYPVMEIS